ncbi:MAG TPA: hypothetical protein VGB18_08015 [Candidatus Thermoplasmatota archaeon]
MKAPRRLLTLLASAILVTSLAGVAAQDATAPAPSGTTNTFYAHHNDDGANDDEYVGWMNTLHTDKDSDDIAMGNAQQCTTGEVAIPVVDPPLDVTWTLTYAPALTSPIQLSPGGTITVTVYIGASGGGGRGDATTTLTQGEVVIFEGESVEHAWEAATAQYAATTWTLTPKVTEIAAGTDLVWTIKLAGDPCDAAGGPFLGVDDERGTSNFVLPIVGGASAEPTTVFHNETGAKVTGVLEFDASTNETHQYNWTTELTSASFSYEGNLTNGSVKITVIDAGDANVVEEDLLESGNGSAIIEDAAPGNWSVRIELVAFVGSFEFELGEAPAASPSPSDSVTTSPSPAGNETDDTEGSTPSPGLLVVLGALLVGTLVASRRRRVP